MPIEITPALIAPYIKEGKRHKAYKDTVDIYKKMKVHADGELPTDLVKKQRPNEDDKVHQYRMSIYEAITEEVVGKIVNSLSKIRKSRDWMVSFDQNTVPPGLSARPEETLQYYTEKGFPFFENITNWLFSVCLKNYLIDPNAFIAVVPVSFTVPDTEFKKPFPFIFNSDRVLDFIPGQLAVFQSTDQATYTYSEKDGKQTTKHDGKIFYIFTDTQVCKLKQQKPDVEGNADAYVSEYLINHDLGFLPCFKLGGVFHKAMDDLFIFKSRINQIVPHLNLIVNEFSDSQAEVVQHVHSEKWVYMSTECPSCQGIGLDQDWSYDPEYPEIKVPPTCRKCNGSRYISTSPYKHMVVTPSKPGEVQVPMPPAGYIDKNTDIIKVIDERIQRHFYNAYAAVEMQNEAKVPVPQSGVAKQYDAEANYVFVHSVAEDLIGILDKTFYMINEWRYNQYIVDKNARVAMLPVIPVPEKYDIFDVNSLILQIKSAKDANLNPVFIKTLEEELAGKQVNADSNVKNSVQLILELDPLFGVPDDQKVSMLSNKGISQEKYVLSCNISEFVRRALREKKDFITLDHNAQLTILNGYVAEEMASMSAAAKAKALISPAA